LTNRNLRQAVLMVGWPIVFSSELGRFHQVVVWLMLWQQLNSVVRRHCLGEYQRQSSEVKNCSNLNAAAAEYLPGQLVQPIGNNYSSK